MMNKKIGIAVLATTMLFGSIAHTNEVLKKDITLVVRGEETQISTYEKNVKTLLTQQNVKYDNDDIISHDLQKTLVDGDVIEVIDVKQENISETKSIDFDSKIVNDSTMLEGKSKVATKGVAGENELVYSMVYHNGELVKKSFVKENVIVKPVDEVIAKGTKKEVVVVAAAIVEEEKPQVEEVKPQVEKPSQEKQKEETKPQVEKPQVEIKPETDKSEVALAGTTMVVNSTAYSINGTTATGTQTRWGVIAVDPSVIPYGTKVYIPELDMTFIAEDTGGAIKGNKIDIYMPTTEQAIQWGRKDITIKILG